MGIIGFIIAISTEVLAARYVSLFLMAGSYASFVVCEYMEFTLKESRAYLLVLNIIFV